MAGIDEVFTALFFGAGSWLGLLLYLAVMVGLLIKSKYIGVLLLPISIFLGITYLSSSLVWHAVIMFFTSIFIVIYIMKKD